MSSDSRVVLDRSPAGLHVKETTLLLAATALLPYLVHLLPLANETPWGAYLLPLFYAPFVGVALYRLHVGLIPALLAPTLSALLTGLPAGGMVALLTVELVLFTLAAYLFLRWKPRLWVAAPLAYVAAKLVSGALVGVVPYFGVTAAPLDFIIGSLITAVPGMTILLVINLAVVLYGARHED